MFHMAPQVGISVTADTPSAVRTLVPPPASAAAEVSYLLIDYVEMSRVLGPLPFRDFCAGYSYRSGTAGRAAPVASEEADRCDAGPLLFAVNARR
jgi:hypothetical protein